MRRNEVFTYYNLIDKHKEIKVRGLKFPSSVTQMETDKGTFNIVCEFLGNGVRIYDDFLVLQKTIIFKVGSGDVEVRGPNRVIILPTNTLLVSDTHNHRVTEFSLDGTFIRMFSKKMMEYTYGFTLLISILIYNRVSFSFGILPPRN